MAKRNEKVSKIALLFGYEFSNDVMLGIEKQHHSYLLPNGDRLDRIPDLFHHVVRTEERESLPQQQNFHQV